MPRAALDAATEEAWRDTLGGNRKQRTRLVLLDRDGKPYDEVVGRVMDGGTVTLDASSAVDRSVALDILDPRRRFTFDADSYYGGDLNLTRQVRVMLDVTGPLLDWEWVEEAVFTGPVTSLARRGPIVSLEGQGREVYGLQRARRTLTIKKGARRTDAIREIARVYFPGIRLAVPDLPHKLSTQLVVHPKDKPWAHITRLADSINGREVLIDGWGTLWLRRRPDKALWVYSRESGSLRSPIDVDTDIQGVRNQVRVVGRTPKGRKEPVSFTATADPDHHFAPRRIGTRREEVNNEHCRTVRECRDLAEAILARRLSLGRTVQYLAEVTPDACPTDPVRVVDDYEVIRHRLQQGVINLSGEDMQVGYTGPYRRRHKKPKGKGKGNR